jgi:hypothetical protein
MKLFLLLSFIFTTLSHASPNKEFLKCLGDEEQYYHKNKLAGPYLTLNKRLISEFIQLSDTITIKRKYQDIVCKSPNTFPSVTLLKLILIHKGNLFVSLAKKNDIVNRSMDERTTDEMSNMAVYALIDFINNFQAQSKKPNCIITKIPELGKFYEQTRYTMEDQGISRLLVTLKDIEGIFKKLGDKNLLKDC